MIGFALTGSFCTFSKTLSLMEKLVQKGHELLPIMSDNAYNTDTRFASAESIRSKIYEITGKEIVHRIVDAEPLGPKVRLDAMIICPCTGNTLSKLANGITDTPVCMAAKAHLRNNNPLVIALASNDGLSASLQNIAALLSRKNIYFTPMMQDDPILKPHSLVSDLGLLEITLEYAIQGKQYPKIFI